MKRFFIPVCLGLSLVTFTSCKNETRSSEKADMPVAEEPTTIPAESASTSLTFKDEAVTKQFNAYLALKDALVKGNASEAASGATALSLASSGNAELEKIASEVAASQDLTAQRAQFAKITSLMEAVISGNLVAGSVYKQYCPMAFDNKGGYWLSASSEILNPYFGDAMLRCGAVKEIIE